MTTKTNPQHYYIAAAMITYVRDDQPRQRHMNVVMELPRKLITSSALNNARSAMLQRLADEVGDSFGGAKDLVFLSFSYLGHAKPDEFYDLKDPSQNSTPIH